MWQRMKSCVVTPIPVATEKSYLPLWASVVTTQREGCAAHCWWTVELHLP